MITIFNFKSQVCTSIEQSRRLLALGLKKETADMYWRMRHTFEGEEIWTCYADYPVRWGVNNMLPAWSLHRMIEMIAGGSEEQMIFLPDPYDEIIEEIAGAIMVNSFNKEYLL